MTKESKDYQRFIGFQSPNYTIVPDELFDQLLVDLSGAELKVLLYIIRRTFGFKKRSDNISLSQMLEGITTKNGRILDKGAGISKKTLLQALRSLSDRNIIISERRQSPDKGNEPTTYSLNIITPDIMANITPPLGEKVHQGVGVKTTPSPRGNNSPTQETVLQQTEQQETDPTNLRMASIFSKNSPKTDENSQTSDPNPHTRENDKTEEFSEENDEDREVIRAYVKDFGRELGDQSKLRSSVSRACNLYQKSGVSRDIFIARMYEAKSITQERTADIRNHRQDDGKALPKKSKMAYWFATLSNLLEGKVPPRRRTRSNQTEAVAI